jgi:hypothetical protein
MNLSLFFLLRRFSRFGMENLAGILLVVQVGVRDVSSGHLCSQVYIIGIKAPYNLNHGG